MIIGTTGQGKSALLMEEVLRRGIPYEQLVKELEPTLEQKERMKKMEEERHSREEARLQAVRDAYWAASNLDDLEFATIHDALVEFCEINDPTNTQSKAVFDLLPAGIIGGGIQWGFDDTEVRDNIYIFVRDNADAVKLAVAGAQ